MAKPGSLALYPLLYVAWADAELAAEELELLRGHLRETGLREGAFAEWLDPEAPPSAERLLHLVDEVRRRAAEISPERKRSLTELGIAIAEADGEHPTREERAAILRIEEALGLGGPDAVATLFDPVRPIAPLPDVRPRFDLDAMVRFLDGPAPETRRRVCALLSDGRFEAVAGLSTADYRARVSEWCRELADEGLGALSYPAEFGGGDDPAAFIATFETLAFFDLSLLTKFGVQFGLFGGSIHQLGSRRHHEKYLRDAGTLALPGCFAMSETLHGSNVYDIQTTAVYDPGTREIVVHTPVPGARKDYIGNAARDGRLATVFAQLEVDGEGRGVHAILVPIRGEDGEPLPGVRIEDCGEKLGLNGVDNGRLHFDRVRVPRGNLLDRFASIDDEGIYRSPIASPARRFFTMLGTLVSGRVAVGSAALGATKVALTIAVRYGARRRQFGPPGDAERILLDYPAHQRRLLPRLAATYALNFALHDLQAEYVAAVTEEAGDSGESETGSGSRRRRLEAAAAGLKACATWHATDTIQACRESCGGRGYLAHNRFAALKADSDVFTTFEGDNTVLMQLVAKDLLTGFRQQFGDLGAFGLARFAAGRAGRAIAERNWVISRKTGETHLRDPGFHDTVFDARRSDLVLSLARRVRHRIARGMTSFDALTDCQHHALTAARAHVECEILRSMIAAERRTPSSDLAEWIERLRSLYALATIEREAAWFLEQGYLDPPKSKAIRRTVTALCAEIRPQAIPLVDAFHVPGSSLEGSIGL
ncbi:acyl-CoA dehydrogenase [Candidatus Palauibacter polyketidifaciens]|uniref:acyl-CoA dehydrogenase family protein n=1 Tax=Candidatus Palauibacter polyketidifaciens TaxID=3056740 RepID=UPI002394F020|nr:acyl-CoA dehydrogenase [Candidatus Palauibacter polyketidifaciens]MDE2719131.1 acyl-CoA dehydrogenase family protein [Candidatus Palauibacter polyketidifaciens]